MQAVQAEMLALLPRLRRFARSLSGTGDAADDLVQATCERGLRSLSTWTPGTRLDSWLFRILHNQWIDGHRRRRTEAAVELDDDLPVGSEDGRRTIEARRELAEVGAAIEALPAPQKAVLLLVCVEDLSYRDAADILGVPIGTVMSRLARAREALAIALDRAPARSRREG